MENTKYSKYIKYELQATTKVQNTETKNMFV